MYRTHHISDRTASQEEKRVSSRAQLELVSKLYAKAKWLETITQFTGSRSPWMKPAKSSARGEVPTQCAFPPRKAGIWVSREPTLLKPGRVTKVRLQGEHVHLSGAGELGIASRSQSAGTLSHQGTHVAAAVYNA